MQSWNLTEIDTPEGSRSPVVLHSRGGGARGAHRAQPGQALGDHQVKEHAWLVVVDGAVEVQAGGESVSAGAGNAAHFEPDERHSVSTRDGARILLLLAPWPGEGHYRGTGLRRGRGAGASPVRFR